MLLSLHRCSAEDSHSWACWNLGCSNTSFVLLTVSEDLPSHGLKGVLCVSSSQDKKCCLWILNYKNKQKQSQKNKASRETAFITHLTTPVLIFLAINSAKRIYVVLQLNIYTSIFLALTHFSCAFRSIKKDQIFTRVVPWPEMSQFPSPPDQFSLLLPVQVLLSTIVILSKLSPFTFLNSCNPSSTTS